MARQVGIGIIAMALAAVAACTAGTARAQATSVEQVYGVWAPTPQCHLDGGFLVFGARTMIDTSLTRNSRATVSYEVEADGVAVVLVREIVARRDGTWEPGPLTQLGTRVVVQRQGDELRTLRVVDRNGRSHPGEANATIYACR